MRKLLTLVLSPSFCFDNALSLQQNGERRSLNAC
jgi:hypothetical protein